MSPSPVTPNVTPNAEPDGQDRNGPLRSGAHESQSPDIIHQTPVTMVASVDSTTGTKRPRDSTPEATHKRMRTGHETSTRIVIDLSQDDDNGGWVIAPISSLADRGVRESPRNTLPIRSARARIPYDEVVEHNEYLMKEDDKLRKLNAFLMAKNETLQNQNNNLRRDVDAFSLQVDVLRQDSEKKRQLKIADDHDNSTAITELIRRVDELTTENTRLNELSLLAADTRDTIEDRNTTLMEQNEGCMTEIERLTEENRQLIGDNEMLAQDNVKLTQDLNDHIASKQQESMEASARIEDLGRQNQTLEVWFASLRLSLEGAVIDAIGQTFDKGKNAPDGSIKDELIEQIKHEDTSG